MAAFFLVIVCSTPCIFSVVASVLRRNRPHPSRTVQRLSTLGPVKSSRRTLKTWRIECVGVILNLVSSERKRKFWERRIVSKSSVEPL
jgi:hypothetical protein